MRRFLALLLVSVPGISGLAAEISFDQLRAHPRLLLTREGEARLKREATENKLLASMLAKLREAAEFAVTVSPATYKLEGPGPRRQLLLHQSQAALSRVLITGLAYRLFDERRFADRALAELRAVTVFADWHPDHFLDTGEMTAVVAIGYDWLYPILADDERGRFREAIIRKGLEPSERFYPDRNWAVAKHNWNQVCNGGLTLGALAIADHEPEVAKKYLSYALASAPNGLRGYAPDGAYPEGPMYWAYGTTFTALMISALDTALGDDFGLSRAAGLDKSGLYMAQMITPRRDFFNYADSHAEDGNGQSSGAMFWLGKKFNRPLYSWFRSHELQQTIASLDVTDLKRTNKYFPLDIVWFDSAGSAPMAQPLPLAAFFRGTEAVAFRTAYEDPRALYVGFKGGNNAANHSHLDLGSFVFEANGVRWALDLGADDYDAEGYWDVKEGRRWKFYRLNTQSHNTLVIDSRNQDPQAIAPIVKYSPTAAHAVADLTAAYPGQAVRVHRGIALQGGISALVQDELEGVPAGLTIRWGMVTKADVSLDGSRAILRQGQEQLHAEILDPKGAVFEIVSTEPPTKEEKRNDGTRMLAVSRSAPASSAVTLRVLLSPARAPIAKPALRPLVQWESVTIER
jgi:hypothetical protein